MMTFVPKDKQSKTARRKAQKEKRRVWGFSPVTRVKESRKVYRRSQKHRGKDMP